MSGRLLRGLFLLVLAGTVARVVVAFATYGVQYDIDSAQIIADALRTPGQGPYHTGRWPYPPGFFPAIWLADGVARASALPFHGVVQLPAIAADAALALVVTRLLSAHGRSTRAALAGAALVALGPSFAIISGYHGQIDAVAILPAVLGVVVWLRDGPRRALWAGLLIGVGAAVKTVPLFTVLGLLPAARDRREALTLVAAAAAVPLLALSPWLVLDTSGTADALTSNHGVPGFGGPSALLQPALTRFWSAWDHPAPPVAPVIWTVTHAQNAIVAAGALAAAALALKRRTPPLDALALLWLTVLVVNPNFAYQYVVWTLPFLLVAGRLREVAVLQGVLVVPSVLLYTHADKSGWIYWALAVLAWLVIVAVWGRAVWRITGSPARLRADPSTIRR